MTAAAVMPLRATTPLRKGEPTPATAGETNSNEKRDLDNASQLQFQSHLQPPPQSQPAQQATDPLWPPQILPVRLSNAGRRSSRTISSDQLNDRATTAFIRRTLCPQNLSDKNGTSPPPPIHELLPPLTSRNDVDLQLYAIIAVVLREFVQNWYNKITPDESFVAEIVQLIAHCTRALEQRLRGVDLESLLFDEIPDLFDRHITAYRASRNPVTQPPTVVDSKEVYHSLCPLPYLSPVPRPDDPQTVFRQQKNERAYRLLLAEGLLSVLLPTEDLENPCLTSLVGQILAETIIGNIIANKASEPWMIWEGLSILAGSKKNRAAGRDEAPSPQGRRRQPTKGPPKKPTPPPRSFSLTLQQFILSMLQCLFVTFAFIRSLVTILASSSSYLRRTDRSSAFHGAATSLNKAADIGDSTRSFGDDEPVGVPILDFKLWQCMGNLVELEMRMPWLYGALSLLQLGLLNGPGRICRYDGMIDRITSHFIHDKILDADRLPHLLRTLRGAIFPNNAPGQPTLFPPANQSEATALRLKCARALASNIPPWMLHVYFSGGLFSQHITEPHHEHHQQHVWPNHQQRTSSSSLQSASPSTPSPASNPPEAKSTPTPTSTTPSTPTTPNPPPPSTTTHPIPAVITAQIDESIVDIFSDPYCNKHLMYSILELIIIRLAPELSQQLVSELWRERLNLE